MKLITCKTVPLLLCYCQVTKSNHNVLLNCTYQQCNFTVQVNLVSSNYSRHSPMQSSCVVSFQIITNLSFDPDASRRLSLEKAQLVT